MKKIRAALGFILLLGALTACQGSDSSSVIEAATYSITAPAVSDAFTITGLPSEAKEGESVRFMVKGKGENVIKEVKANDEVLTSSGTMGVYRFKMPAQNVVISVSTNTVSSITLDTTGAKTTFFVGGTFASDGLKVVVTYGDNTKGTLEKGFEVSSPDLTSIGEKEVIVTYGGKRATYKVVVGEFLSTAASIVTNSDNATVNLLISGTYQGFNDAASLTAAAKGVAGINLQNHSGEGIDNWNNAYGTVDIDFADAGAGAWNYSIDIYAFAGAGGNGRSYIIHFGVTAPDANGSLNPANLDVPDCDTQAVTVGTKSYSLYYNSEWKVVEIRIIDSDSPYILADSYTLSYDETADVVYMNVSGTYGYLSEEQLSSDNLVTTFYLDMLQLDTWTSINATTDTLNAPSPVTVKADTTDTHKGTFGVKLPIARFAKKTAPTEEGGDPTLGDRVSLKTSPDYFFHFSSTTSNLKANIASGAQNIQVTDKDGGVYTLYTISTTDWKAGMLGLNYLGGDYVMNKSAALTAEDTKAIFSLNGIYSGITDTSDERYYADIMSFEDTTKLDITNNVVLTPESTGATRGTFAIEMDLTGKLAADKTYFFHYGANTGTADAPAYSNLALAVTETTIEVGDGTYTLKNVSGYTATDETWRNGLTTITFTPKAA